MSNEKTLLARVAACNFSETIFDTDDLSAIRGGSLLLLEFPDKLIQLFKDKRHKVDVTAQGASELLFRTSASDADINKICELFYNSPPYSHFTFVHAVAPLLNDAGFKGALDVVVRGCNEKQYRQPTVKDYAAGGVVCEFTGVLPADSDKKDKEKPVSASIKSRRNAGRRAKQDFYVEYQDAPIPDAKEFANEFSHMRPNADESAGLPESLKGKMAVLYLDGNGFRTIRKDHSETPEAYKKFSDNVTAHRRKLLTDVVKHVVDTDNNHDVLRLETLLWGGDEVMWVLPAFAAWEFMKVVQKNLNDESIWGKQLTHSCGLLIAPYKAPIKDLRALAESLGDAAKDCPKGKECPDGRNMNGVQIEFIKGFDLPGLNAGALRDEFLNSDDDHRAFQLDGSKWNEVDKAMRDIKDIVPRSALHRVYQQAARDGLHRLEKAADAKQWLEKEIKRIEKVNGDLPDDIKKYLTNGFPGAQDAAERFPLVPLRQILQFWDLVPENNGGAK